MSYLSYFDYHYLSDLLWLCLEVLEYFRDDEWNSNSKGNLTELANSLDRLTNEFEFHIVGDSDSHYRSIYRQAGMAVTTAIRLKRFIRLFEENRTRVFRLIRLWMDDNGMEELDFLSDYNGILRLSAREHHEAQSRITDWLNVTIKEMEVFGK